MKELKEQIYQNSIEYWLIGDFYFPNIELPEEIRPIGKWGHMYLSYLKQTNALQLNNLILTGKFFSILADINEECRSRYQCIVRQMVKAEGVTEDMKQRSQMEWVRAMNSISNRAKEIIKAELIYT